MLCRCVLGSINFLVRMRAHQGCLIHLDNWIAELHDLIFFVKQLLETFIVSLDEGMGGKSSKHGGDGDSKKADKGRKRRSASDSIPAKGVPPIGLANIEDSPFLSRTGSGAPAPVAVTVAT